MQPLEWICNQFEKRRTISEDSVSRAFDSNVAQQALLMLNYLVAQGLVSRSLHGGKSIFIIEDMGSVKQLLVDSQSISPSPSMPGGGVSGIHQGSNHSPASISESLVVSVPLSMTGRLLALKKRYHQLVIEDLREAFSNLLYGAHHEILMSVPFLELDGLMVFVDEFKNLGQHQVPVKALTRELVAPRRLDYGYYQKLRAFAKLVDVYVSGGGKPEQLEVRDYTIKIGGAGDHRLIYEGIHQKMIVIDRERAYVGSGEIRAPSFVVNGDVGVVQLGRAAEFWADYFLLFWSEAQKVEHHFFQAAQS